MNRIIAYLFGNRKQRATSPRRSARRPAPRFRPRLERLEDRTVPSTIFWDGGGDGLSWDDRLNWDIDRLPTFQDDAVIDMPGEVSVQVTQGVSRTLISQEALVIRGSLRLGDFDFFRTPPNTWTFVDGFLQFPFSSVINNDVTIFGELVGLGDVTINGQLTLLDGTLTNGVPGGAISTIPRLFADFRLFANGGLEIQPFFRGPTLENTMLVNNGNAHLDLSVGGVNLDGSFGTAFLGSQIVNGPSGVLNIVVDGSRAAFGVGGFLDRAFFTRHREALINHGTIRVENQNGATTILPLSANHGTIELVSGKMTFDSMRQSSGSFLGARGTLILFRDSGAIPFGPRPQFTSSSRIVADQVVFSGGPFEMAGTYNARRTILNNAEVTFTGVVVSRGTVSTSSAPPESFVFPPFPSGVRAVEAPATPLPPRLEIGLIAGPSAAPVQVSVANAAGLGPDTDKVDRFTRTDLADSSGPDLAPSTGFGGAASAFFEGSAPTNFAQRIEGSSEPQYTLVFGVPVPAPSQGEREQQTVDLAAAKETPLGPVPTLRTAYANPSEPAAAIDARSQAIDAIFTSDYAVIGLSGVQLNPLDERTGVPQKKLKETTPRHAPETEQQEAPAPDDATTGSMSDIGAGLALLLASAGAWQAARLRLRKAANSQ